MSIKCVAFLLLSYKNHVYKYGYKLPIDYGFCDNCIMIPLWDYQIGDDGKMKIEQTIL